VAARAITTSRIALTSLVLTSQMHSALSALAAASRRPGSAGGAAFCGSTHMRRAFL
jgi:hypothetical protein